MGFIKNKISSVAERFGYHVGLYPPVADKLESYLSILFEKFNINLVVDVGANKGQYGRLIRGVGYRGRIISFEPVDSVRKELMEVASGDPRWHTRPEAVSDEEGSDTINVRKTLDVSSLKPRSERGHELMGSKGETVAKQSVQLASLDAMWPTFGEGVDGGVLLKTDAQGHDWEVLRGAEEILDRMVVVQFEGSFQPLYENSKSFYEIKGYLKERGFELGGLFPVNYDRELRLLEVDCVMIKP